MGLSVRLKDDIRNMLRALYVAQMEAAKRTEGEEAKAYTQGYMAALAAVGLALGISPLETTAVSPNPLVDPENPLEHDGQARSSHSRLLGEPRQFLIVGDKRGST